MQNARSSNFPGIPILELRVHPSARRQAGRSHGGSKAMSFLKQIRITGVALLALGLGIASADSASALTIDCASAGCLGGIYTLDVRETAPDLYLATYTVDTTGSFTVGATSLVDINIKVANDYLNPILVSGPSGSLLSGPLTGRGCSGTNGSFLCVDLAPNLALGSVYSWQIQFGASEILEEWYVGARYTSPTHRNGWVISESGTNPIPEPSAALIFGAGMLVASGLVTRSGSIE